MLNVLSETDCLPQIGERTRLSDNIYLQPDN